MGFEDLTRSKEDYIWAIEQMATCPGLTEHECSIIIELYKAALISVEDFDRRRREVMLIMPGPLMTIINKCRAHGIGREWRTHAVQS